MTDVIKAFEAECQAEVAAQGQDEKLKGLARDFFNESAKHKYSYHFSWMGRPIIQLPQDMLAMQEIIWRVKPDLIITGGRSSAKYAQLASIAPTLDMREDHSQPIATALSNLDMLAKAFGKQQQAEDLKAALDSTLQNVRTDAANRGNGLVVLVTGGKLSAYGPGSRFGLLHSALQIPPALADLKPSLHGEAISPELIMKANPDWLFVIDRDAAIGKHGAARQVLDNPLVRRTHAWQNNQVVYLDPVNWYLVGSGIQAVNKMLRQLDEAFDAAG